MSAFKNYLSLIKFSHTIFAMPFALIGFFLGWKSRSPVVAWKPGKMPAPGSGFAGGVWWEFASKLVLVVLCMIFARSAAMAFNRYLDRNFDARNPRTAIREIPRGIISSGSALRFVVFNCMAFVLCALCINPLCFFLSPLALLVVLGYSYTKRFTALCHIILGIGLSLAPIGAYLAVAGAFAVLPVLFSLAVVFWVSGFDIIYALQDIEFDRSQQLHSIPAALGRVGALRVSEWLHLLSAAAVLIAGLYGHFHGWFWMGFAGFTGMLLYQHSIVKPGDLSRVNIAFMTANGIASVIFAVFVITDIFLYIPY